MPKIAPTPKTALLLLTLLALPLLAACPETEETPRETMIVDLDVAVVDTTIVAGGALLLDVGGAGLLRPIRVTVVAEGDAGGVALREDLEAEHEKVEDRLRVTVPWAELSNKLQPAVADAHRFDGNLSVVVEDVDIDLAGAGVARGVELTFETGLQPVFYPDPELSVFLNEVTEIPAEGLLRDGEGESSVLVWGEFRVGDERLPVNSILPVTMGGETREVAVVRWSAAAFGVRPGVCDCEMVPRNQRPGEDLVLGPSIPVSIEVQASEVDLLDPSIAGRGQVFSVLGRGFIPPDTDGGTSMFFELSGELTTAQGSFDLTGTNTVLIPPDTVPDYTEARVALRTELLDGSEGRTLTGLSANPGMFRGTLTPIMVEEDRLVRGIGAEIEAEITSPHQYVFVKFLPGFSTALESYGLRNVEIEVRRRIFEVVERDFEGIGITFSDERPTDFVEYSIIEVGGPDPNGLGLFGLDNTEGKDTGNIRLDDIIGGENADAREQGFLSFGGVFIDSFVNFSPTLSPDHPATDPMFDSIFSPIMAQLGGEAVQASEWPSGPRTTEIELAYITLANLIGDSLAHEIGHSLGLTYFPEDDVSPTGRFHNADDEEGSIMDEGVFRPFGERAELPGFMVPRFNASNRAYLERILPKR